MEEPSLEFRPRDINVLISGSNPRSGRKFCIRICIKLESILFNKQLLLNMFV